MKHLSIVVNLEHIAILIAFVIVERVLKKCILKSEIVNWTTMKLDPNTLCDTGPKQNIGWAIFHDLVAHPLLVITFYSVASVKFHNWTSLKAWPLQPPRGKQ